MSSSLKTDHQNNNRNNNHHQQNNQIGSMWVNASVLFRPWVWPGNCPVLSNKTIEVSVVFLEQPFFSLGKPAAVRTVGCLCPVKWMLFNEKGHWVSPQFLVKKKKRLQFCLSAATVCGTSVDSLGPCNTHSKWKQDKTNTGHLLLRPHKLYSD